MSITQKIIAVLLLVATFMHATLAFFKVYFLHDTLGVVTIPLVLVYYLVGARRKVNIGYVLGVLAVFIGDYIMTLSYKGNFMMALSFFGIAYLVFSFLVLGRMATIKTKSILKVSIPFLIIYLLPSLYFSLYFNVTSASMLFHNTAVGLFICTIILKLINEGSVRLNINLALCGLFLFLMILFSGYEMFVAYNPFIATYGVMLSFALNNYFLATYFINVAKHPKRIKQ